MLEKMEEGSHSVWQAFKQGVSGNRLFEDQTSDVCVIGAGIAGLTTAYLLQREGKSVTVVDSFAVASGQTERTTAHLSASLGTRYFELETYHGAKGAALIAESHTAAIAEIEKICNREGIDCDFTRVSGFLFRGQKDDQRILEKELAACQRAGLSEVSIVPGTNLLRLFSPGESVLEFPKQAQFNPLKYVEALSRIFLKNGGRIFENTKVSSVAGGEKAFVETSDGLKIRCTSIVVATNSPVNDLFAIHTKQAPYRTYALALEIGNTRDGHGLYWDTEDPYHYIRTTAEGLLIVGGEDHKTGQNTHTEDAYGELEKWIRQRLPDLGAVVAKWSGQVMESMDGVGFIGHNPLDNKNVYVITGDSGNGLTHGTLGAMLVRDQILGVANEWAKVYAPNRVRARAAKEFVIENANVAAQYLDWIKPAGSKSSEELKPGEGQVIREGLNYIAISKDASGAIYKCSAVCPHLGGIVRWNNSEKSWDCPCHGSRFAANGKVLEGPTTIDLKEL